MRYVLTDAQWARMSPLCLGKVGDRGRSGMNNRLFVEAVLWIVRTGSPWRDLPIEFGKWNTVFKRFRDWVKADVFQKLFDVASAPQTWNTPWWMQRLCESIDMGKVQKGVFGPGHRSQPGRLDYENLGAYRCPWEFGPIRFIARSEA